MIFAQFECVSIPISTLTLSGIEYFFGAGRSPPPGPLRKSKGARTPMIIAPLRSHDSPSILVRVHDIKVTYNITVLFYECDDHTLINISVHFYQTKSGRISDEMAN